MGAVMNYVSPEKVALFQGKAQILGFPARVYRPSAEAAAQERRLAWEHYSIICGLSWCAEDTDLRFQDAQARCDIASELARCCIASIEVA